MTVALTAVAVKMTEATLQETVRKMCVNLKLFHYHPHDSRRSESGWPDSVIIGPRGILYRELKSHRGTLTSEQTTVRYLLLAVGADYAVWKPLDLLDGTVAAQLAAIA